MPVAEAAAKLLLQIFYQIPSSEVLGQDRSYPYLKPCTHSREEPEKEEGPRDSHRSHLCPLEKAPPVH